MIQIYVWFFTFEPTGLHCIIHITIITAVDLLSISSFLYNSATFISYGSIRVSISERLISDIYLPIFFIFSSAVIGYTNNSLRYWPMTKCAVKVKVSQISPQICTMMRLCFVHVFRSAHLWLISCDRYLPQGPCTWIMHDAQWHKAGYTDSTACIPLCKFIKSKKYIL